MIWLAYNLGQTLNGQLCLRLDFMEKIPFRIWEISGDKLLECPFKFAYYKIVSNFGFLSRYFSQNVL